MQRTNAEVPAEVSELLGRLRDPDFARMLVVTLAESTPVQEAERLQTDLRRAGIEPYGWAVNASLSGTPTAHPTLRARAAAERPHVDKGRPLDEVRATRDDIVRRVEILVQELDDTAALASEHPA